MKSFAITGATGLLGQNFLFEIVKQNYRDLSQVKLILFGRNSKTDSLEDRISAIVEDNITEYVDNDDFEIENLRKWLKSNIIYINYQLDLPNLGINNEDLALLKKEKIDFFCHIAALTNLWHDNESKKQLEAINVSGTNEILKLVKKLNNVEEFVYVGTAYSCGETYGDISPGYINKNKFRNNYEMTKLKSELLVREFESETGIKCRYFRPSVVCGRMIEKEIGKVSKFDVFYGWGSFFVQLKRKYVSDIKN